MSNNHPQSFFKLPLILVSIFFISFFLIQVGVYCSLNKFDIDSFLFVVFILLSNIQLFPLLLFFTSAIFLCQKYRLHSVTDFGVKVGFIGFILAILYFCYSLLITTVSLSLVNYYHLLFIPIISFAIKLIYNLLPIFFFCILFMLLAKKNVHNRQIFVLEGIKGERIYAHTYSFIMLLFTVSFFTSIVLTHRVILFSLVVLYYFVIFWGCRNSFKKIEPTINVSKMIFTALILLLLESIIPLLDLILLSGIFFSSLDDDIAFITLFYSMIISFVLCFFFSRLSVRLRYQ